MRTLGTDRIFPARNPIAKRGWNPGAGDLMVLPGWTREGKGEEREAYSYVACICPLTVDHASLSRPGKEAGREGRTSVDQLRQENQQGH